MVQTSHVVWSTPHPLGYSSYVVPSDASAVIKSWAEILSDAGFPVYICDGSGDETQVASAIAVGNANKGVKCLPGFYTFAAPLQIPAVQNYFFDARGCTFTGGVHMESAMDSTFIFDVVTGNPTCLEIEPTLDSEILGGGSVIAFTMCKVYWNSLAGTYTSGAVGLRLTCPDGNEISGNEFSGNLIEVATTGIYVPYSTGRVNKNKIIVRSINQGDYGFVDGDGSGSPFYHNDVEIGHINLLSGGSGVGLSIYGDDNFFKLIGVGNASSNNAIVFNSTTHNNTILSGKNIWTPGITMGGSLNHIMGNGTYNNGSSTILNGTTSAVVTHGMSFTLTIRDISIALGENPTNTPGAIWVDTINGTTFTVNCENDPGTSNLDFGWTVRKA